MNKKIFYSIWAIFNNKQKKEFENIKKKINIKLKGPDFPIHMTISAGFEGNENLLIDKMNLCLAKLDIFTVKLDNYGYKNKFFQSLYIKVINNKMLNNQKKIIDNTFNCKTKIFFPHISLFYGNTTTSIKKNIIANLPNLQKTIKINNLCLAINEEDKKKWIIIKNFLINKKT